VFRRHLVLCLLLPACATVPSVDAALHRDLSTLRRSIATEQRNGALDRSRAGEIAQAVAAREIYSGVGPGAAARIRSLRACAPPVMDALEARSSRQDEPAAEATLVLLANRRVAAEPLASRYDDADSGAWRAVAARASLTPSRFFKRRLYFVDPDQRVRRAALEAALESPAPLDQPALAEAARLDPDAQCRSLATRALGTIGGERAVRALMDLWEHGDDDDRVTLVEALSKRATLVSGGRAELLHIAESERGVPAVAAAGALLRVDPDSASQALALLARAITEGSSDEQALAIQLAPLTGPVVPALQVAIHDADPDLRVAALTRLLESPSERKRALAALRDEAKDQDGAADAARAALARTGDRSVEPGFVQALTSPAWQTRQEAGLALVSLGDFVHASTLLADDDANVRVAVACRILGS
jgi:HEAT repeat protein